MDTIARIGERFGSLGKSGNTIINVIQGAMSNIEGEVRFYLWLRGGSSSSIDQALRRATDTIAREIEAERVAKLSKLRKRRRPKVAVRPPRERAAERGRSTAPICFGYLALTIALAEVVVGNAENALHLLEAEINNQRASLQEEVRHRQVAKRKEPKRRAALAACPSR